MGSPEIMRDVISRVSRAHDRLPDLTSYGRAEIDLRVTVLVGDPRHQILQRQRWLQAGLDDQGAVHHGDINLGLLIQASLCREGLWDLNRQAVLPLLDFGSHRVSGSQRAYSPGGANARLGQSDPLTYPVGRAPWALVEKREPLAQRRYPSSVKES